MNESILNFIARQSCASICCIDEAGNPYCFSCFYAINTTELHLYFKSSANSFHAKKLKQNPVIAGTILPDTLNKLFIKGVQFEGIVLDPELPVVKQSLVSYFKKYPLSLAFPGETWAVQINRIKLTDSTLGFGKKEIWERTATS